MSPDEIVREGFPPDQNDGRGVRILVKRRCVLIDDDLDFLERTKRFFAANYPEFELFAFVSSTQGADHIRAQGADLIVTAYLVAPMDGLQLISLVRSFNAAVPIVMLSAVPIRTIALARGATAFLNKAALWTGLGAMIQSVQRQRAA